ncbi:MAG TPA: hypothetical protein VGQ53_01575 [Chitinophagaceae bacterium]|nr:hypothetical protein [Chitinophagaceae bacterium]
MATEKVSEVSWVKTFIQQLQVELNGADNTLFASDGRNLPYSNEVLSYNSENEPLNTFSPEYTTDILIYEKNGDAWKPRIVIEVKLGKVTTHDAITYSQKSQSHKNVHPFLRYGILIGNRKHYPLPGRLFRHGTNFDFMLSWKDHEAGKEEWGLLLEVIFDEICSSRKLEEIIYNSRSRSREKFTKLHRPLRLA